MSNLSRRSFLSLTGGAAAAGVFGSFWIDPAIVSAAAQAAEPGTRTLVVVDLQGGNDALNTFVPIDGRYHDARPTVGLADNELAAFARLNFGVHPQLVGLERFWNANQLAAIYGSGLEGQGRSHFVAQDAWRTARPDRPSQSGWLGRWLEASAVSGQTPLRAVSIGQSALATQGDFLQPVAVQALGELAVASAPLADAMISMTQTPLPGVLGQVQQSVPDAVWASNNLERVLGPITVAEDADPYADISAFQAARALIQAELGTQVIYLTVAGFDTHANQPDRHALLLKLLADGLVDLFTGLESTGQAKTTLALVVSEFGRRVAENGSAGTDHGRGGLSFFVGPAVRSSTVVGSPDLTDLVNGDLRITTDARVLYNNALRWLGASSEQSELVLGGNWSSLDLLSA